MDIYFDVVPTDVWTAAGIRAVTQAGATIIYCDEDPNTQGIQPTLFNGGIANKFATMLSKPRGREAPARFTNGGEGAAGAYDPPAASPVTIANQLNVVYFANPLETPSSPAVDGYIARIAIDITEVKERPAFPIDQYPNWGAGPISFVPHGAVVVLRSVPQNQVGDTATATSDVPQLSFISWAVWYTPEPTSITLLVLGGLAARRRF